MALNEKYIPSLNGLRALCIIMVISDHLMLHNYIKHNTINKVLGIVFFNGGLGVDIFFLISGFLITNLLIQEHEAYGKVSFKKFYKRRTLRIFPAYYALLFVYYLLQKTNYLHLSTMNWISDLTYTKQFFQDEAVETTHLWSLSVEELFYLIWPFLYVRFFSKASIKYLACLVVSFAFLRFQNYAYPKYHYSNTIFSTGDALLVGCFVAIYYDRLAAWVCNNSRVLLLAFLLLFVLAFTEPYVYHLVSMRQHTKNQIFLQYLVLPLLNALCGSKGLLTNVLVAIILVYSINVRGYWYRFLNAPITNYIGLLSYSLYLWQQIFITDRMRNLYLPLPTIILCIAVSAHMSYYLIEKPFLRLKRHFSSLANEKQNAISTFYGQKI